MSLQLDFWGVRGSIPTPQRENLGYGGNTACCELSWDGGTLIIDAGTGIRRLGKQCVAGPVHIFLSHFHWDHIQGLPYFDPLYDPSREVAFYSASPAPHLEEVLEAQMASPCFPARHALHARQCYREAPDCGVHLDGALVRPFALHHPGGSTGYRVEAGGSVLVYACDHEHGNAEADLVLRRMAEGADALIFDACYTPAEYEQRRGWGHSTWLEAVRIAREAGVKRLFLFHHEPARDDDGVTAVLKEAQSEFASTEAAWEVGRISLKASVG